MDKSARVLYWDSCVFLSYIEEVPGRISTLEDVLEEISENKDSIIFTSSMSTVEVAFSDGEKDKRKLDPEIQSKIDALWEDNSVVEMVDLSPIVAQMSRKLMRDALPHGKSLKPNDAIHLATAEWLNKYVRSIDEFQTYDQKLESYGPMIGIKVCEPHVVQHRMDI
jgi:predicted nucleic acid-binding protein